ncbi:hypothetical protein A3I48_03225 [Candidatus Daviesbacteria bacterium RIFCSPLOWO2_02_FULL_36_7]|uniref:EF-hand domain-containing protein n=1 Tax=Candidatus Daviesbacteria bacterium RIFCSPLOWO2_02_FULL_36_7 TaxID=1797792 RepID=A0A1F5MFY9_9BACT|nr:MAG: hypothetical protein A3I48_03225 [Candidatus Daviesbacteria bacterium RIFCSPLOWO2_02_FULL_36_7]
MNERINPFIPISPEVAGRIITDFVQDPDSITRRAFTVAGEVFGDVNFTFRIIDSDKDGSPNVETLTGAMFTLLAGSMTGRERFNRQIPGHDSFYSLIIFGMSPWKYPKKAENRQKEYLNRVQQDPALMKVLSQIRSGMNDANDETFQKKVLRGAALMYCYLDEEGAEARIGV